MDIIVSRLREMDNLQRSNPILKAAAHHLILTPGVEFGMPFSSDVIQQYRC
jgi:hypothetical protein